MISAPGAAAEGAAMEFPHSGQTVLSFRRIAPHLEQDIAAPRRAEPSEGVFILSLRRLF
jgi:hypothetical protein